MNEEMQKYGYCIDIGNNYTLEYRVPEEYTKFYSIYHGQKYCNYYFRNSTKALIEKVNRINSGYLIYKDAVPIGGAFIKPNFLADLFVIPPFRDYEILVKKILFFLKSISNATEEIYIQEVVDELVEVYEVNGCTVKENGYWMTRPTEVMNIVTPKDYEARNITNEDKYSIADLIIASYKNNPAISTVWDKDIYVGQVENFFSYIKDNEVLYNSSLIVKSKFSKETVGVCFLMEFEELPLITQIAVNPKYQGKGIGSFMLRHGISCTSTKYSAIRLYVDNNNNAMNIYKHLGFINNKKINDMNFIIT